MTTLLYPLPWHTSARLALDHVRAGQESVLFYGPKGTGKSCFVKAEAALPSTPRHRRICYVSLGDVRSGAAVLTAVLDALQHEATGRARRRGTTYLLGLCAAELYRQDIGALALDELPFLSTSALAHAAQLIDHCALRHGHALGLLLISTVGDHRALRESGELGQRISSMLEVRLLDRDQVEAAFKALGAAVAKCVLNAPARHRADILDALVLKTDGSIRRLSRIIQRAHALADRAGTAVTLAHVESAISMQADE